MKEKLAHQEHIFSEKEKKVSSKVENSLQDKMQLIQCARKSSCLLCMGSSLLIVRKRHNLEKIQLREAIFIILILIRSQTHIIHFSFDN